jgi:hypothetical protein
MKIMKYLRLFLAFCVAFGVACGVACISAPLVAQTAAPAQASDKLAVAPPVASVAPPRIIYLMRHAEKPEGDKKDPNLTPVGYKRAQALPSLFVPQPNPAQPGTVTRPRLLHPDAVFATAESKHSNRPYETVTPLAKALHEPINNRYEDDDYASLAKEVLGGKYANEVLVIAWHHGQIPHLAQALGVTGAPKKWDDACFNQIWKIDYTSGTPVLTILEEGLLPGDPAAN